MKKNLFNFAKALLLGFAFVVVGCSDYDEDIKALNNRIDQEIIKGQIDPLKMDLQKTAADLKAAQSALENEIKAAHQEDVQNLKDADANLQSAIKAANAAIVELSTELNGRINGVESNFNEQIASVNQKIDEANAAIATLQSDVEGLNAKDQQFAEQLAGLQAQLTALDGELKDLIAKNADNIANNATGIATNAAAIEEIKQNLAAQAAVFTAYQAAVDGKIASLEAADVAINNAIATLDGSIKTLESTKLNVADFETYKAEVVGLFEAVNESLATLEAATTSLMLKDIALDAKDAEFAKKIKQLETTAADLQTQLNEAFGNIAANTANIAALQISVNKNKTSIDANTASIKKVVADLEAAVAALEAKDAELSAADKALEASLSAKYAELVAADQALATDIAAKYAELVAADEALAAKYAELALEVANNFATLKAADEALAEVIAENYETLKAADEALAAQYAKLALEVLENYNELKAADEALAAEIVKQCAAVQADLNAKYAELVAADEAINEDLAAKYNELKAVDEAYALKFAELYAADEALAAKYAEVAADLANKYADLKNADAAFAAKIVELELTDADLAKQIVLNYKELVSADEALAAKYAELAAENVKLANDLANKYDELVAKDKELANAYAEVAAANAALAVELADKYAALVAADEALEANLDEKYAELAAVDAQAAIDLANIYNELKNEDAKMAAAAAAKYAEFAAIDKELAFLIANLTGTVDKNCVRLDKIEAAAAKLEDEFKAFQTSVKEQFAAVDKANADQDGRLNLAEAAIVSLQESVNEINSDIETINANIADMNEKIWAELKNLKSMFEETAEDLQNQIDAIVNRVQSVVYIPEYNDGKATVNFAVLESETVIEAASKMQYQIYPAACAEAIAKVWTPESDVLTFFIKSLADASTRAAAPSFEITKVEANNEGVLTITFNSRGFSEEFYAGQVDFSTSLVVKTDDAILSSCFTALAPSNRTTKAIDVALYNVKDNEEQVIEYTRRAEGTEEFKEVKILEGHYVGYTISGDENVYTWDQMAAMGYAITAPVYKYNVTGYDDADEADEAVLAYFNYTKMQSGDATSELEAGKDFTANAKVQPFVSLTKLAVDETVGSKLNFEVVYNANGVELSKSSKVIIGKDVANISATVKDIVWNYNADAQQDAYKFAGEAYSYSRTAIAFENIVDNLDDITVAEVLANAGTITCNKSVTASIEVIDGKPVLNIADFAWGETYEFTATYSLDAVEVQFTFAVTTVGRTNETIKIEATDNVALYKNIKFNAFDETTALMSLDAIYDSAAAAYDLGIFAEDKAAFLAEVLVDKAYAFNANIVATNGVDTDSRDSNGTTTALIVDKENAKASVGFSYNTFKTFIATTVTYTKNITLWYGQPVQLVYTLNFDMPEAGYNFAHNDLWVFEKDGRWVSQVQGNYGADKMTVALESFKVDNIDMDMAFQIVDKDQNVLMDDAEIKAAGLVTEFEFVTAPKHPGITIANNVITYNGSDAEVFVKGKLYLKHGNGARIAIPTRFDGDGEYSDYSVLKFDPLTDIYAANANIAIKEIQKYSVNVLEYFDLFESRKGDNKATVLGEGEGAFKVDLITEDATWLIGDGTNGWAAGQDKASMYNGFTFSYSDVDVQIPQQYKNAIKWDSTNGVLSFDNTYNMKLSVPVSIKVKLNVNYTWAPEGGKSATSVITFYNPDVTTIE